MPNGGMMMASYDEMRDRIANYSVAGQVQQSILSAEIGKMQLEAFQAAGVDMDALGDPLKVGKYKDELAKLDLKKLGQQIGDHVLGRTVIKSLGSYGEGFMGDLKKARDGSLTGDAKEQYDAMLDLIKQGTGYDEAGFTSRLKANPLNFAAAVGRDVQNVAQWRATSAQRQAQNVTLAENYAAFKKGDESFSDLTSRFSRDVDRTTEDTLEGILGRK
jgi:hypothetical protein